MRARVLLVMSFVSACATAGAIDRDRDGVPDLSDACADVPGRPPDGCPAPDVDGDGVIEVRDGCPDVAGDGEDGCPYDSDGDGVPDARDLCPVDPETTNNFEDEDGCPDRPLDHVASGQIVIRPMPFAAGKSAIAARLEPDVDHLATILNERPKLRLMISGHTDAKEKKPAELSLRRAEAIRDYLIERGVAADRLEVRGVGADEPADSGATAAARARNRRVDFTPLSD